MSHRSTPAAAGRAAPAALSGPEDFDCYLLIDDTDEYASEICTVLRERGCGSLEVSS
jgi:hypothetical protein